MSTAPVSDPDTGLPPNDLQAEQSVLGGMLQSRNAIATVTEIVHQVEDFYRPKHRAVYDCILELYKHGDPPDAVTVAAELDRRHELQRVGGAPYLYDLLAATPAAANAGYYAELVREKAVLRRLVEAGARITQLGQHGAAGADLDEVVDRAQAAVHEATVDTRAHAEGPVAGAEASATVLAELANPTRRDLVQTGLIDLDSVMGGLEPGEITVVCGRPAHGKTLLGLQIARHATLNQGKHALIFSLEMARSLVLQRFLAAHPAAGVPLGKITDKGTAGALTEHDWQLLQDVNTDLQTARLWIDDASYQTTATVRTTVRRHIQQHGELDLIVIDQLGLLSSTGSAETQALRVGAMTRELKVLAGELGVPLLLVHQVNRNPQQRLDKRPTLADLKDSGSVEQDAFAVIGVYSPDVDTHDPDEHTGESELLLLKHRQGADGTVRVGWQPAVARFANMRRDRADLPITDRVDTPAPTLPA